MGHILGGTMTALNADVRRTALQVGGAGFSTMMFRARPFTRFLFLMDYSMPDGSISRSCTRTCRASSIASIQQLRALPP